MKLIKKHQLGGWIDKKKNIWNWDSIDRMNRVAKYFRGESEDLDKGDKIYLVNNPELYSRLHNIYKTSKLPKKRTTAIEAPAKYTTNMPNGADPNAEVPIVPDSTSNYKRYIGVGNYKLLQKPTKSSKPAADKPDKTKQASALSNMLSNKQALWNRWAENLNRRKMFNIWSKYVRKWHPEMFGKFKLTMEASGLTYDLDHGTYTDGTHIYRLHNGQLQTRKDSRQPWQNVDNRYDIRGFWPKLLSALDKLKKLHDRF